MSTSLTPRLRRTAAGALAACSTLALLSAVTPSRAESRPATAATAVTSVRPAAVTPVPISRTRLSTALVASGFVDPVLVRSAPGDPLRRLFVVEQSGRVRVVQNGVLRSAPFLDIRSIVTSGGERGMLGLAFPADFATSRLVFVTYTRADGALTVARFTVSSSSAPSVTLSSRRTILVVPHPSYANHNGGDIAFGPDGYLYLGTGDGGSAGDPSNNAQNLRSLLGKMLRIDVRCAGHVYCIPSTNPYARSTTYRREIWMSGLRNPWRWSFDLNGTQWIGDVGQDRFEEVDAVPSTTARARNLGWSCREGLHTYRSSRCRSGVAYTNPVLELCHPDTVSGCASSRAAEALIGGYVYRGSLNKPFHGTYVLGDYVTGRIWPFRSPSLGTPLSLPGVSGFGTDYRREIYAVTLGGGLYRIGFHAV
jgi:hypothetical protein